MLRWVLFGLPQLAMPLCWIAATEGGLTLALREVWPRCFDADTGWAWGEHSVPGVVRVQCALCAENWVPGSSSQETDSLHEVVEIESDCEPESPCTMVDCQGSDVFDIPAEARMRCLDEHELLHFVFEHGVSQGLRLAECHSGQDRARDRQDENVFDIPAIARRRGWDEHGAGGHEEDGGGVA